MKLQLDTDPAQGLVRLRLLDDHERQLGDHQVRLSDHSPSIWQGLFDTRRHVQRYAGNRRAEGRDSPQTEAEVLAELGVFLGREVLGADIMAALTRSRQRRTLQVALPGTEQDLLAAAFARVPWEIARDAVDQPGLMARNLVVRVVTATTAEPDPAVLEAGAEVDAGREPLRILLVYAEAPGDRPLAMRQEREALVELFQTQIQPRRDVQVDVLCHGVTRDSLRRRIADARGYISCTGAATVTSTACNCRPQTAAGTASPAPTWST